MLSKRVRNGTVRGQSFRARLLFSLWGNISHLRRSQQSLSIDGRRFFFGACQLTSVCPFLPRPPFREHWAPFLKWPSTRPKQQFVAATVATVRSELEAKFSIPHNKIVDKLENHHGNVVLLNQMEKSEH